MYSPKLNVNDCLMTIIIKDDEVCPQSVTAVSDGKANDTDQETERIITAASNRGEEEVVKAAPNSSPHIESCENSGAGDEEPGQPGE